MQYVFSMTSRMVTIAVCCALLLSVLLFLLGIEIGARFVAPSASNTPPSAIAHPQSSTPDFPAAASSSAQGEMAAVSPSS
jgi:hypothetical protein